MNSTIAGVVVDHSVGVNEMIEGLLRLASVWVAAELANEPDNALAACKSLERGIRGAISTAAPGVPRNEDQTGGK
jgi:hypothetical protein